MNWFFNQWFLGSGHPRLEFEQSVSEGELTVTVHQNQNLELSPIYKIPMEIAIHDDNGKSVHKILVDKLEEEFTFPISGEVKGILYDHQEMLLCNKNEDKTLDQYIFQYYNSDRYMTRSVGLKKGGKARNDRGQQLILDAMDDEFWGIREEAVDMTNKLKDNFRVKGIEKLKDLAKNDPKSAVRLAALEKLGKLIDDWSKLESNYVAIVETDSSYSVITGALAGIGQENPEKALELAAGLESERSSTMLSGIAQIYAGHGEADKYEFFERILMGNVLQGFDVLGASSAFTYFVSRQDPELIGKSIPVYEHLSEGGGYYMSMFLPQNLSYLKKGIGKMQSELDDKIAMHEENGDALYADQARKKIKDYDVVADKIEEFINRLNAENGDNQLMFGGEEDDE